MLLPAILGTIGRAVVNTVKNIGGKTTVTIGGQNQNPNSNIMNQTNDSTSTPKPEIIKGIPNMFLLIGGAVAAYFFLMPKGRRR